MKNTDICMIERQKRLNCCGTCNLPIIIVSGVHSLGEVQLYPGSHGVVQIALRQRVVKSVLYFNTHRKGFLI